MFKKIKKNVLVLTSTFPRWKNDTTPSFVYELEKRLTDDFNIYILAPHYNRAKKNEEYDNLIITRFQYYWPAENQKLCYEGGILPNLKKNKLLSIQAFTLILIELITAINIVIRKKIDIIHAHWIIPQGIIAVIINKIFGTPYIITVHGADIFGFQNVIILRLKKYILGNAQKITVVSHAIKNEIIQKINPKLCVEVLPMGVDPKKFNPSHFDKSIKDEFQISGPLLLFVGRLVEKKGVSYLIQALSQIVKSFPGVKLLIIGNGPLESELKQLVINLNLQKFIFFLGPIQNKDLPKYYATSDIFIGPSIKTSEGDTEGLGLTFVEASFSGCIPIGSNIGGIPDVIINNESGLLINEKDSEKIADSVISLLKNKSAMMKIRRKSRILTVKKFDWKIISEQYRQTYSEII